MTEQEQVERIAELETEEEHARKHLGFLQKALDTAKLNLYEMRWGVRLGSLVKSTRPMSKDQIVRVTFIYTDNSVTFRPWVVGVAKLKDGTFGSRRVHLTNWELCKEQYEQ